MHNILHVHEFWPNGTTMELAAFEHLKNLCLHFFWILLIQSFLDLQVTKTRTKSWMSSNFVKI